MGKRTNPNFINGVPELLILRLLDDREMYGYELVKAIRLASEKKLSFGEGCIYPLLHSLERKGFLKSRQTQHNGRNRLYYRTTSRGSKELGVLTGEWRSVVEGVISILGATYEHT